jgi:hypothetical protein
MASSDVAFVANNSWQLVTRAQRGRDLLLLLRLLGIRTGRSTCLPSPEWCGRLLGFWRVRCLVGLTIEGVGQVASAIIPTWKGSMSEYLKKVGGKRAKRKKGRRCRKCKHRLDKKVKDH